MSSRIFLRANQDDSGLGIILVLGVTMALALIVVATLGVAVNSLSSSRLHVEFEASLDAAETGLEATLGLIQTANDAGGSYTSPGSCSASWTWPSTTVPTIAQETAWARAAFAAMPGSCVQNAGAGQYIAFRALDQAGRVVPVVYAIGYSPSKATDATGRILKAQFVFSPYSPAYAILAKATIAFTGAVDISVGAGATAASADVFAVGNITNSGALTVDGSLSATGTNSLVGSCPSVSITGSCVQGAAAQAVPTSTARGIYRSLSASMPLGWYDLCPDGSVRRPDPLSATPCLGTSTLLSGSGTYRGWAFSGSGSSKTWTFTPVVGTPYPGAYYAFQTNVVVTGSGPAGTTATLTAIAEAAPTGGLAASCNKSGGDIAWSNSNVDAYLPGVVFVADGQLTSTVNATVGVGLLVAADNFISTPASGTTTSIEGAILTNNNCAIRAGNTIQRTNLVFDDTADVPLATTVRTTEWLELVG